jgi:hypothetical protein
MDAGRSCRRSTTCRDEEAKIVWLRPSLSKSEAKRKIVSNMVRVADRRARRSSMATRRL